MSMHVEVPDDWDAEQVLRYVRYVWNKKMGPGNLLWEESDFLSSDEDVKYGINVTTWVNINAVSTSDVFPA